MEAVFSPGEEVIHVTQTAEGFDSDNYIHVRTTIRGKIPYIPETSTVQIAPYYEIYQYSGSGKWRGSGLGCFELQGISS